MDLHVMVPEGHEVGIAVGAVCSLVCECDGMNIKTLILGRLRATCSRIIVGATSVR